MREIQVRDKCICCDNGMVESNLWKEWGIKFDAWSAAHDNMGFNHPEADQWEKDNPVPNESDMLQCIECEGTTWMYKWVDLIEITR